MKLIFLSSLRTKHCHVVEKTGIFVVVETRQGASCQPAVRVGVQWELGRQSRMLFSEDVDPQVRMGFEEQTGSPAAKSSHPHGWYWEQVYIQAGVSSKSWMVTRK